MDANVSTARQPLSAEPCRSPVIADGCRDAGEAAQVFGDEHPEFRPRRQPGSQEKFSPHPDVARTVRLAGARDAAPRR